MVRKDNYWYWLKESVNNMKFGEMYYKDQIFRDVYADIPNSSEKRYVSSCIRSLVRLGVLESYGKGNHIVLLKTINIPYNLTTTTIKNCIKNKVSIKSFHRLIKIKILNEKIKSDCIVN